MKPFLRINFLKLIGDRKVYSIPFSDGMNIVYGDSDTGKSSILEFINYLLGSSSIELADEVKETIKYAALDITINKITYTIMRDIYDYNKVIDVYQCAYEQCENFIPKKYIPKYEKTESLDGYFSDFLLDSLGYPKIKLKESPSKEDSKYKRMSFRNLFKYVYVNQDDIGSKSFLGANNWILATINKEVFKYIFNILDTSIMELEAQLSEHLVKRNSLKQKHGIITDFLNETRHETISTLDNSLDEIDKHIEDIEQNLASINIEMKSSSENYNEIKSIFNTLSNQYNKTQQEIHKTKNKLTSYNKLKNDYSNDFDKLNSILHIQTSIVKYETHSNPCPICNTLIKPRNAEDHYYNSDENAIAGELKTIKHKRSSIQGLIDEFSAKLLLLNKEKKEINADLERAREMLDIKSKSMITPYLTQRDALINEIAHKKEVKTQLQNNLRIRNRQNSILQEYQNIDLKLAQLRKDVEKLKLEAPDITDVTNKLGVFLIDYLEKINIKKRHDISISQKTFLPVVRDRDYIKITSGGLRTITSVGYMLALLRYSINSNINHPRIIMIDTVGKYLGKTTKEKYLEETTESEDLKEGISDPIKYQNMYDYMIRLTELAQKKKSPCQIILVDNDVPGEFSEKYKDFIVAHYNSNGEDNLSIGLIDDADR